MKYDFTSFIDRNGKDALALDTQQYYDSIIQWQESRNAVKGLKKEHIGYQNGVLGGLISAMRIFCSNGDKVLVHSPTYIGFTNCLGNNAFDIVHSPLILDEHGIWRMEIQWVRMRLETRLPLAEL